jgi:hypothetical protein
MPILKRKRFIAEKICTAFLRRSYKIVPLTNLNKCLYNETSEREVNVNISVNNDSKNSKKLSIVAVKKIKKKCK